MRYLAVHRFDIAYFIICEKNILGIPSSHSLRLVPCCGLMPRWVRTPLPSRGASTHIPRSEARTDGGANAAFRHTENVGFRNHQNFGAYNQHPSLQPIIPSPCLTSACYQDGCGVVLRWWLDFSRAGFSPSGECEFIPALSCNSSGAREFVTKSAEGIANKANLTNANPE